MREPVNSNPYQSSDIVVSESSKTEPSDVLRFAILTFTLGAFLAIAHAVYRYWQQLNYSPPTPAGPHIHFYPLQDQILVAIFEATMSGVAVTAIAQSVRLLIISFRRKTT